MTRRVAPRPNIEEVFSVFQAHQTEIAHIMRSCRMGLWPAEMERARAKFKLRFDEIGLGAHIDWTERQQP